jgi:hypothetical protein
MLSGGVFCLCVIPSVVVTVGFSPRQAAKLKGLMDRGQE